MSREIVNAGDLFRIYLQVRKSSGLHAAINYVSESLAFADETSWLSFSEYLTKANAWQGASQILEVARQKYPQSAEIVTTLSQAYLFSGNPIKAEKITIEFLEREPENFKAVWILADALREQGRYSASVKSINPIATQASLPQKLKCIEWMQICQRPRESYDLCLQVLRTGCKDPSALALSGQLALKFGNFAEARSQFLLALDQNVDLNRWFILQALSMTKPYESSDDPDLERFQAALRIKTLSSRARASILFGQAKLFVDIHDFSRASRYLLEAHDLLSRESTWSLQNWNQFVEARTTSTYPEVVASARQNFTPIFIVGLPRTGTSLLANRLSKKQGICDRGEIGWLKFIANKLYSAATINDQLVRILSDLYYRHVRQDDIACEYYIDKTPNNFRYVDIIRILFPNARIIYCRRNLRDTAISIYSQFFENPDNAFSNSFSNIESYAAGARRLIAHWQKESRVPIYVCDYEKLVGDPHSEIEKIETYIGIRSLSEKKSAEDIPIATASAWQARQAIYKNSIGRSECFHNYLPEMLAVIPDAKMTT